MGDFEADLARGSSSCAGERLRERSLDGLRSDFAFVWLEDRSLDGLRLDFAFDLLLDRERLCDFLREWERERRPDLERERRLLRDRERERLLDLERLLLRLLRERRLLRDLDLLPE